jgi:hypothetical protein
MPARPQVQWWASSHASDRCAAGAQRLLALLPALWPEAEPSPQPELKDLKVRAYVLPAVLGKRAVPGNCCLGPCHGDAWDVCCQSCHLLGMLNNYETRGMVLYIDKHSNMWCCSVELVSCIL